MKLLRQGCFETNSSSSHTLVLVSDLDCATNHFRNEMENLIEQSIENNPEAFFVEQTEKGKKANLTIKYTPYDKGNLFYSYYSEESELWTKIDYFVSQKYVESGAKTIEKFLASEEFKFVQEVLEFEFYTTLKMIDFDGKLHLKIELELDKDSISSIDHDSYCIFEDFSLEDCRSWIFHPHNKLILDWWG